MVTAVLTGCPPAPSASKTLTLAWAAPTKNADGSPIGAIAGYRVYVGTAPDMLFLRGGVSGAASTVFLVTGLQPGTYYFAVSAYTQSGLESERSAVIEKSL